MKKRLFALLLIVALVVVVSVFAVGAEEQATNPFAEQTGKVTAHCAHCGREVVWAPVPTETNGEAQVWPDVVDNDGKTYYEKGITHFYLTADSALGSSTKATADQTLCFELNGKTWTRTSWVFFDVQGGTINLFDSSLEKTGTCVQTGSANTWDWVLEVVTGTFNQYGGNLVHNNTAYKGSGSCVNVYGGTYNMYGGTMNGYTTGYGGAIYIGGGTFNMEGGTITGYAGVGGGAVQIKGWSTFNMKGGTMLNCKTYSSCNSSDLWTTPPWDGATSANKGRGGAVLVELGYFNMSGGTIDGGTVVGGKTPSYDADKKNASYGGAIAVASGTATISGDAVIKGCSANWMGGAVIVYHGTYWKDASTAGTYDYAGYLNMTGGTIKDNYSWYMGGAVSVNGAPTTISGGKIYGNNVYGDAGRGANIYVTGQSAAKKGTVTINGTAQIGPDALPAAAQYVTPGTGIFAHENVVININGGTIQNLWTTGNGGVIHTNSSSVSINMTAGLVQNCKANNGGFIALNCGSPVTISGGTIQNCAATTAGGAIANYASYGAPITLSGEAQIKNCSAGTIGGAIALQVSGGSLTIQGGTIDGCSAVWGGGGVYIDGGATSEMTGGVLKNCTTTTTNTHWDSAVQFSATAPTSYGKGGGVLVMNGTFNMSAGKISACQGSYGGGIFIASNTASGIANISGTAVIENCWAHTRGGGVGVVQGKYWSDATGSWLSVPYDNRGKLTITGGEFKNNTANAANGANGGAIFVYTAQDVSISNATITGSNDTNNKNAYQGAAVYVGPDSSLTMTNVTMTNMAGSQGTIFMAGENDTRKAVLNISNCTIDGSKMTDNCSGIMANAYADLTWTNNTIQNSYSSWTGGAVYLNKTTTTNINGGLIKNCWINTTSPGAGLWMDAAANVESVVGLTIEGCKAAGGNGGNVYVSAGQTVTFEDCTFIGTGTLDAAQANYGGNVFVGNNSNVTFIGCEIKDGAATSGGGNIHIDGTSGAANVTVTDCVISGGKTSTTAGGSGGNINSYKSNVTVNGNTVIDGKNATAQWAGANIRMYGGAGTLNLAGNAVIEGTPKGTVSVSAEAGSNVTLAGDINVDQLLVRYNTSTGEMTTGAVTVKEGYTGQVAVTIDLDTLNATFEPGTEIGAWMTQEAGYENTGAVLIHHITGGWINGSYATRYLADTGDKFVVATFTGVKDDEQFGLATMPESGEFDFVNVLTGGEIALAGDTTVRLNGQAAKFDNGEFELTVIDTATDDCKTAGTPFEVTNPDNLVKYVKNADTGYQYVIVEENGTYTANRVQVTLDFIAIKPSQQGIYYITTIKANVAAGSQIQIYGTAVSLATENIGADFLADPTVLYTAFAAKNLDTDDNGNVIMSTNSALISGILTEGDANNATYAGMKIYANSYIVVDNNYIMADESFGYSLNDAMKMLDANLDETNTAKAVEFYQKWQSAFAGVELPNLEAAANAA